MRTTNVVLNLNLVLALLTASAAAQQQGPVPSANLTPKVDLSVGFDHIQANAPPGACNCFGLNGGFVEGGYHFTHMFSAVAEATGGHANDISALGQNLTLTTFLAGPRASFHLHKLVPYGQVLVGLGHGSDSYFPNGTSSSTSASSFALSAGGGLDIDLTRRIAVRAVEVQYLRTAFPNGSTNVQEHLMIGAGIVLKFGGHRPPPPPPPTPVAVAAPRSDINFTCSENVSHLDQGETLKVLGNTMTEPDQLEVAYSWTSSGGPLDGEGREVTLNTAPLPPGKYWVKGHAQAVADPQLAANCELVFQINPLPTVKWVPEPGPVVESKQELKKEKVFHENVQDALFDYNSAAIRTDAQTAIDHAAWYLKEHPEIRVQVGGFADERGTIEYNLQLGQQRAESARDALIRMGVAPERIEIISYGKEAQVCTASTEICYQQNRRAAFQLHP